MGWSESELCPAFLGTGPLVNQITGRGMKKAEVKTVLKSRRMGAGMTISACRCSAGPVR